MIKPGRAPDYRDRDYARKIEPIISRHSTLALAPAKTLFEKYERIMQESFQSLCEAVAYIKTKHLYRQVGYDTFEDCCEDRWGISKSTGYRLADANATLKSLKPFPKLATVISNENQARALSTVKKSKRPAVLNRIVKSGDPVTAKRIAEEAKPEELKPRESAPNIIDVEPEPQRPAPTHRITIEIAECLVCETETLCLIEGKVGLCKPCIMAAFKIRE